ncbi:MAG: hypothetical protein WCY18_00510 [Methanofastidiosum sp.]
MFVIKGPFEVAGSALNFVKINGKNISMTLPTTTININESPIICIDVFPAITLSVIVNILLQY